MSLPEGIWDSQVDGGILLSLKTSLYQKEAIFQAVYKFLNNYHILIDLIETPGKEPYISVRFQHKPNAMNDLSLMVLDFCNEVIDQQVRLNLEQRFGPIREMIFRQAFSPISRSKENAKTKE